MRLKVLFARVNQHSALFVCCVHFSTAHFLHGTMQPRISGGTAGRHPGCARSPRRPGLSRGRLQLGQRVHRAADCLQAPRAGLLRHSVSPAQRELGGRKPCRASVVVQAQSVGKTICSASATSSLKQRAAASVFGQNEVVFNRKIGIDQDFAEAKWGEIQYEFQCGVLLFSFDGIYSNSL